MKLQDKMQLIMDFCESSLYPECSPKPTRNQIRAWLTFKTSFKEDENKSDE